MARTPSAAQVLGHVVLVTGKEEYLSARTVASVREAVRAHDAEAELAESTASDLTLASLGARLALVSVGEDNDYGHPATDLVAALSAAGASVWRTDVSGDVVVVVRDGELGVVARG